MYIYNDNKYQSKNSARWAAFFDKLGIDYTYINNDGVERFDLYKMKVIAPVAPQDPDLQTARAWLASLALPELDTGRFGEPQGTSVAILNGNPWKDDSVRPLGTTYSKSEQPRVMSFNDKAYQGFFLTVSGFPALVVKGLEKGVHCGGCLLSVGDLGRILTDEDQKHWIDAAKYARDVEVAVEIPKREIPSFNLDDKEEPEEQTDEDPLAGFRDRVEQNEETEKEDQPKPTVNTDLRPFGQSVNQPEEKPTNRPQSVYRKPEPEETVEPTQATPEVEEVEEDDPQFTETDQAELNSFFARRDAEVQKHEEPEPQPEQPASTLTSEDIKNIADEAEQNIKNIDKEDRPPVEEQPKEEEKPEDEPPVEPESQVEEEPKKRSLISRFIFVDDDEDEPAPVKEKKHHKHHKEAPTEPPVEESAPAEPPVEEPVHEEPPVLTATPEPEPSSSPAPQTILKADDPSAPHGEDKKNAIMDWIHSTITESDTINHDIDIDELIRKCERNIGVEVTHDEMLWCMLREEFPYQQRGGKEYFGLKD